MDITVALRWTGQNQSCEVAVAKKNPDGTVSALPSPTQLSVLATCYPDASYLLEQKLSDYIDELTRFRDNILRTRLVYEETTKVDALPK